MEGFFLQKKAAYFRFDVKIRKYAGVYATLIYQTAGEWIANIRA
jgi:hypothetical protein